MAAARPTFLTPEEAAAIARCSIKTVRRAYATGALPAYRRRGSRAVLLDNTDVLEWAQGQVLQPTVPNIRPIESVPGRPGTRKRARRVDQEARTPKLGSQLRFDLSAEGLRDRRTSKTDPVR
jgi:excisionase family DNA binding protein